VDDVEAAVRRSFVQRADGAPDGVALLLRVRAETRRRRRRERTGLVAAAVVGLVTFATLAVRLLPLGTSEPPAAAGAVDGTVRFGAGDVYAVAFPYTPAHPLVDLDSPYVTLVAGDPALDYSAGMHDSTVRVRRQPPPSMPTDHAVAVHDRKGFTWTEGSHRLLVWQEGPDRWIEIRVPVEYQAPALVKYADGLSEAPLPMTRPFTFTLVPISLVVDNIGPSAVTFRPSHLPPDEGYAGKITVMLGRDGEAPSGGRLHAVGGAKVRIAALTGGTVAWVDLDEGAVVVQVSEELTVNETELAWFAAGIKPTAIARAASG